MEENAPEKLVDRVRAGDAAAAAELNGYLRPRLELYVARKLGTRIATRVDVDDVVQETLLEIFAIIRKSERSIERLAALAKTIARHVMHRVSQRKSLLFKPLAAGGGDDTTGRIDPADRSPGPKTELVRKERTRLIEEALAALRPEHAMIVRLRLGEGKKRKFKDIGDLVGMSPEAAEKAYLRAKARIKEYLGRRRRPGGSDTSI